jgi:hypothetical protein
MVKLNTDTISLITAADMIAGCSVERLREAYAGLEKRTKTISQIKCLIKTYGQFGLESVEL